MRHFINTTRFPARYLAVWIIISALLTGTSFPAYSKSATGQQNPVLSSVSSLPELPSLPSLKDHFDAEKIHQTQTFSKSILETLMTRHVVLVDGIMNELASMARNYYTDYIRTFRSNGITYSHLAYSSRSAIPKNAKQLSNDLLRISSEVKKPIILIGHSMGGAEALYAVMKKPQLLIENHVENVIILQGAIGGSAMASHPRDTPSARLITKYLGEGLESLRPTVARRNFEDIEFAYRLAVWGAYRDRGEEGIAKAFQDLSNRIFYVQAAQPAGKELSWGLRTILPFFDQSTLKGPNDGLLEIGSQILPEVGHSLGIFEADHIELAVSGPVSHSDSKTRKAFVRALLTKVYETKDIEKTAMKNYARVIAEANKRDEAPEDFN